MVKTIKITIPKITFDVQVQIDDDTKNIKKEKSKEECEDFYFAALNNHSIKCKNIRVLTLQDCLTVPVYTIQVIKKENFSRDTILGWNNVLPQCRIVFGDKSLIEVRNRLFSDRFKILEQLTRFSKALFDNYVFDIISLNTKKILYHVNVYSGKEEPNE